MSSMSKNVGSIGVKLSTGLSKKMPARVRDIARPRQTENATRDLRGPRRTSDVLLDTAVNIILLQPYFSWKESH